MKNNHTVEKVLTGRVQCIEILLSAEAVELDAEGEMRSINKRKLVNAIAEALLANGAVMFRGKGQEFASDQHRFQMYARVFDKKPGLPEDFNV